MKCEICHHADAETVLRKTVDGVEKELYVCRACAAADRRPARKAAPEENSAPEISVLGGDDKPPAFVEDLVKATLGFMKGVAEAEQNEKRTCPSCRRNWDKIKETGLLGCPTCWKTFSEQIREEFLATQFGKRHLGSAPDLSSEQAPEDQRAILARALKAAVRREDYREAARIQRQIDALKPDGDKESAS